MAPVMVMEAERENQEAVSLRHRVLIAAAVAVVVGGRFRILSIDPVRTPVLSGWKHTGRIPPPAGPVVRRPPPAIPAETPGEEETDAPSNHA